MNFDKLLQICEGFAEIKTVPEICCQMISKKSKCRLCLENCPVNGIAIEEGQIFIDQCVRCGACVEVCPNHVFYLGNESALFKGKSDKKLILTCIRMYKCLHKEEQKKVNTVYCLKQLYPELMLALLRDYSEVQIYIDQKKCESCLRFDPAVLINKLANYPFCLDNLHFNEDLTMLKDEKTGAVEVDIQRRAFFRSIFAQAKALPMQALETALGFNEFLDHPSSTSHRYQPLKRRYLVHAFNKLPDACAVLPIPDLKVTDCVFCETCVRLCPFQALKIERRGEAVDLLFDPSQCTACGICKDVCYFKGITLDGTLTVEELLDPVYKTLVSAPIRSCPQCGHEYAYVGSHPLCPSCGVKLSRNSL